MKWILLFVVAIYFAGFGLTFWMHTQMPVTFALALLRSLLWPVWMLTGVPHGQSLPMD